MNWTFDAGIPILTSMVHRRIYLALGFVFVAIGVAGVVLPIVPTTPMMLLALWAFARSSQRFHDWLLNHRQFGPPLQRWKEHGVIPAKTKVMSLTIMSLSLIYLAGYSEAPALAVAAAALLMLVGAVFIITRPSRAPAPVLDDDQVS